MIIVDNNKNRMFNAEYIKQFYVDYRNGLIKAKFDENSSCAIGGYDTPEDIDIAMEMLIEAYNKVEVFKMPTKKQIQARINSTHDTIQRASNGKKTVRRGGS